MTCPSVRRGRLAGASGHQTDVAGLHRVADALSQAREHLRGDDTVAQFSRFVFAGGLSTLLYGLVFITLDGFGDQLANLVGAIASTMLANELHRRLTFHSGERVSFFTAQWEGGGLAAVGLVATSLTLAGLNALFGEVAALTQIAMVTVVTGMIGALRFVALRAWVFSTGTARRS